MALQIRGFNRQHTVMGLDVLHMVLLHHPADPADYLTTEDWDSICNVPLEVYAPYLTDVRAYEFKREIAFLKNEAEAQALKKTTADAYEKIFVGLPENKKAAEIENYITQQKLGALERIDCTVEHDGLSYYTVSFGEPVSKKGFYYQEIGYQRKGMTKAFYEIFSAYDLWGRRADFEWAYACINLDWYTKHLGGEHATAILQTFKASFLDTFQYGRSLLSVSF